MKNGIILLAVLVCMTSAAQATLLLYEPFDYATGNIATVDTSGGPAIGFDPGSQWSENSTRTTNIHAGSLGFGTMANTGNKFQYWSGGTDGSNTVQRGIALNQSSGDLWMAYLYQPTAATPRLKGGVHVDPDNNNTLITRKFGASSALQGSTTNGNLQLYYNNVRAEGTAVSSSTVNQMWIHKYTDLGSASGGTATLWTIDAADYDAIASGGVTEAELDANNIQKIFTTLTGTAATLNWTDTLRIYVRDNGSGTGTFYVDEIRMATTLNEAMDVTIPEPATMSLLALGGMAMLRRRKK